jgi:D-ornithine 4,5-aminomutase subunit beta
VDSGEYPETNDDGIGRDSQGGVAAGSIVPRADDYLAPVCHHFGDNHLELLAEFGGEGAGVAGSAGGQVTPGGAPGEGRACDLIGGCTFCDDAKVPFTDELDPTDNAPLRLMQTAEARRAGLITPEVEWAGDGIVAVTMFLPAAEPVAEAAALEIGRAMNLLDCEVIHKRVMHPAEGTLIELKGRLDVAIDPATLTLPEPPDLLDDEEIRDFVHERNLRVVAATVGEDEHSVGMREIIDIKHGGLEKWGFGVTYLGTSVPIDKVLDAAVEHAASAVLISTIITHGDVHREMMRKLADLAAEKGVREKILLVAGGTQVTDEIARDSGMDAGFGRRSKGLDVASFIVREMRARGL